MSRPRSIIISTPMVRDGYFYGAGSLLAAGVIVWLAAWPYAVPVVLLAAFFLWFFRDPERQIPTVPGAVVSPGDGKVTDVSLVTVGGTSLSRISIFLSVFDVHVNRSPIAGVIREVRYQRGKFLNAMSGHSAEENEQNIVTVEGEGRIVVFKQIAGLIARRIVFNFKVGDRVAAIQVKPGDRVKGGTTVLAFLPVRQAVSGVETGLRPVQAGQSPASTR